MTVLVAFAIEIPEPAAIVIAGPVIELIEEIYPDGAACHVPIPLASVVNTYPAVAVVPSLNTLAFRSVKNPLRYSSITVVPPAPEESPTLIGIFLNKA